jgi:transposase
MTTLADDLVPDKLWAIIAPLLPPPRPPYGGRHRTISDRACFAAIIYMARTSTRESMVTTERPTPLCLKSPSSN